MIAAMALELVPLCIFDVSLAPPIIVGVTPLGTRVIGEITAVSVVGERLNGKMRGTAGADWLTMSPDNSVGTVDVRWAMETDDGAVIYLHYNGRLDMASFPPVATVAPLFDTGDERYAWLNFIQAVARGTFNDDLSELHYEVYELR
jgi:hypothetical protein